MSCGICPEVPPPPSISDLDTCVGYFDTSVTELEVFIYLALCVPSGGFQFSLEFDGLPVMEDILAEGGIADLNLVDVSGGNGVVIGVDITGSSPIPAGTVCECKAGPGIENDMTCSS